MVTYTEKGADGRVVKEIYELSYLPEGYSLSIENIRPMGVQYEFKNANEDYIWFEQKSIDALRDKIIASDMSESKFDTTLVIVYPTYIFNFFYFFFVC